MDRLSQKQRALQHLLQHGSVTARELINDYGMGSPRKRMSELRHSPELAALGYRLVTKEETGKNRYGEPVTYNRYYLEERT